VEYKVVVQQYLESYIYDVTWYSYELLNDKKQLVTVTVTF